MSARVIKPAREPRLQDLESGQKGRSLDPEQDSGQVPNVWHRLECGQGEPNKSLGLLRPGNGARRGVSVTAIWGRGS